MKEKNIARAYARSLVELGEIAGADVVGELIRFTEVINSSNDLENVLFLEVFTVEEKQSVLGAILEKLQVCVLVRNFFAFLCQEKRLGLFPLIFKEVIVLDDDKKGFLKGTVWGPEKEITSGQVKQLVDYMKQALGKDVQLAYEQNANIAAGYKLNVGDLQLDATVNNQLEQFRDTILAGEQGDRL